MKKARWFSFMLAILLSGCTEKEQAILEAKSNTWKVVIEYIPQSSGYQEIPRVQYLGTEPVTEAEVEILYSNNSSTGNRLQGKQFFESDKMIDLPTRSKVEDLEEVQSVEVTWTTNGKQKQELLPVVHMSQ